LSLAAGEDLSLHRSSLGLHGGAPQDNVGQDTVDHRNGFVAHPTSFDIARTFPCPEMECRVEGYFGGVRTRLTHVPCRSARSLLSYIGVARSLVTRRLARPGRMHALAWSTTAGDGSSYRRRAAEPAKRWASVSDMVGSPAALRMSRWAEWCMARIVERLRWARCTFQECNFMREN